MPSLPPSLGPCNFYFDAQNGLFMPNPPALEGWDDQSGYLWGSGYGNGFGKNHDIVELRASSTVALNTGLAANYVWFGAGDESISGTMAAHGTNQAPGPNLPFAGTTGPQGSQRHPFYDFYMIVGVEGTNQHVNNGYLRLNDNWGAGAPGVPSNYAIHTFSNGQSPSGLTMRATIQNTYYAEWHVPAAHIAVDKWKLIHVSFTRTAAKIHLGVVQKATATYNLSTMPGGKYGRIGANHAPYSGSGDPRGIMFMMAFGSTTAGHTSVQIETAINYVMNMYSGGSGGGAQLVA